MNQINPSKLLHSKWTRVVPEGKERHFIVSKLRLSDNRDVIGCDLEAVINKHIYQINWQELKNDECWLMGWK